MEKLKPYPTRDSIFINQKNGLMYERLISDWHNRLLGQQMNELQKLEAYRKADGVVVMTSRFRWNTINANSSWCYHLLIIEIVIIFIVALE